MIGKMIHFIIILNFFQKKESMNNITTPIFSNMYSTNSIKIMHILQKASNNVRKASAIWWPFDSSISF